MIHAATHANYAWNSALNLVMSRPIEQSKYVKEQTAKITKHQKTICSFKLGKDEPEWNQNHTMPKGPVPN